MTISLPCERLDQGHHDFHYKLIHDRLIIELFFRFGYQDENQAQDWIY